MDALLAALRAAAEPTRLRLLALAARGAFCVTELTEILGQSQPRLSRHLKLLCESGLLAREREGANAWFALPTGPDGAPGPRDWPPTCRPTTPSWKPTAARPPASWPSAPAPPTNASAARAPTGTKCAPSTCPPQRSKPPCCSLVPDDAPARLLDIGTGTGRVLELLAPRVAQGLGVDASKAMLALARARLARAGLTHCAVRLADMYRLPLADASFDIAVLQMVLHYAEDPAGVLAEAARVLRPDGRLIVIDLARHGTDDVAAKLAHRWPGFDDATMAELLGEAGLYGGAPLDRARPAGGPHLAGNTPRRCAGAPLARTGG